MRSRWKQVNIPVPMYSAMWGRRKLGQPTVGIVGHKRVGVRIQANPGSVTLEA